MPTFCHTFRPSQREGLVVMGQAGSSGGAPGGEKKPTEKKKYEPPPPTQLGKRKKRRRGGDGNASRLPDGACVLVCVCVFVCSRVGSFV